MHVICQDCRSQAIFEPQRFRCDCGGAWEPELRENFSPNKIHLQVNSLWRYQDQLGSSELDPGVSMGAGCTPLVSTIWQGYETSFKLEYISPTGSFKDRGVEVEIAFLKAAGVKEIVEDSSGNAGAAAAAYAARAVINAQIFAPESAPVAKLDQIAVFRAELHRIPGPRIEATNAVLREVDRGTVYASHAYSPVYLLGQQTFAWEIWEQTGGKLPDAVIIPCGQGGLLMGAWLGFQRLLSSSVIKRIPALYAAQPQMLAPIHHAWINKLADIPVLDPIGLSIADGLAIAKPVRSRRILQAIQESGGGAVAVSEDAIRRAYFDLAAHGMFVEPSSAVAAAAIEQVRESLGAGRNIAVALTGSGMKTPLLVK